jgi:hypothetical protein
MWDKKRVGEERPVRDGPSHYVADGAAQIPPVPMTSPHSRRGALEAGRLARRLASRIYRLHLENAGATDRACFLRAEHRTYVPGNL